MENAKGGEFYVQLAKGSYLCQVSSNGGYETEGFGIHLGNGIGNRQNCGIFMTGTPWFILIESDQPYGRKEEFNRHYDPHQCGL